MERSDAFLDLAGENIPALGLCLACGEDTLIWFGHGDVECAECGWAGEALGAAGILENQSENQEVK